MLPARSISSSTQLQQRSSAEYFKGSARTWFAALSNKSRLQRVSPRSVLRKCYCEYNHDAGTWLILYPPKIPDLISSSMYWVRNEKSCPQIFPWLAWQHILIVLRTHGCHSIIFFGTSKLLVLFLAILENLLTPEKLFVVVAPKFIIVISKKNKWDIA